ncbi:acyltransferase family protein [Desulfitobacterium chlororespirans]|uniref:Fucose 4-O-acetylase n=1 Tax=Desulfitobacterium chlororespirans DSM 11544 TaxID=1121395 RepID=A0A1M7U7H7_9FIRM|nr:acyltransferase family protein [Desulfitobacterium chlororespirans]SHN78989.1 Fucose 4-O-acetylase [Desulfitobacterium chlororespirans DSM 11544]
MIAGEGSNSLVKRVLWIDILKGLGIIAVVLGHSGYQNGYFMFFFHMPLFVFASGYLYKKNFNMSWCEASKRKFKHLMVPYIVYMLLITLIMCSYNLVAGASLPKALNLDWRSLILGGSLLNGAYGVFWFATFLFTVQILYDFLQRKVKSSWFLGLIIIAFYGIAHWESTNYQHIFVPGNVDVALFGIIFYALGHLFHEKDWFNKERAGRLLLLGSIAYLAVFFYLYGEGMIRFGLDLKHRQYYFWGTVILTPLSCTIIIAYLSKLLSRIKVIRTVLEFLGQATMEIMYLHIMTGIIISRFIPLPWYLFLLAGLIFPGIWYYSLLKLKELRDIRSYTRYFAKEKI